MHGRHRRFRSGCGPGHRRAPSREEWLRRLEEYQKDLEEEVADVADILRRLKEEQPQETATV